MTIISSEEFDGLHVIDYVIIVIYFLVVLFFGLYISHKSRRDTMKGYFLSSRTMTFIPVGASLFASNIGSGHFIGLAGAGAASGVGVSFFELSAIFILLILGWLFVPVYLVSGIYTMPEYLRKRFGGQRIRVYLSVLTLFLYIFTKISADLYAGALFITQATKIEGESAIYISILFLLAIACLFTVLGGLSAVIWTDFLQTVIMILGAIALSAISFYEAGGYSSLVTNFFLATAKNRSYVVPDDPESGFCGGIPEDSMNLFRSVHSADFPWTGMTFGLTILSIWYWCSDQVIVQRTLAAKNLSHAKGGVIFAGYLKLLPLFLMIFPGMAARVFFPDEVGCADPETCYRVCNSRSSCTNIAFIKLVNQVMPVGMRGIMLAVMLSALMSSLTSIFNSGATIFTVDIYKRIRKHAFETELLIVSRIFVVVLVIISVLWIPVVNNAQGSQLFVYIQSITSFLAPPICMIFLLAVFWPRCNEPGAFWGLMTGLVIGMIRFALQYGYTKPPCGSSDPIPPGWWYQLIDSVHFMNFAIILWAITGIVAVVVSLMTEKIPEKHLYRLTYWSRDSHEVREDLDKGDGIEDKDHLKDKYKNGDGGETIHLDNDDDEPGLKDKCISCIHILCTCRSKSKGDVSGEMGEDNIAYEIDCNGAIRLPEASVKSMEDQAKEAAQFLDEHPTSQTLTTLNAMLLVGVTCLVIGYYW